MGRERSFENGAVSHLCSILILYFTYGDFFPPPQPGFRLLCPEPPCARRVLAILRKVLIGASWLLCQKGVRRCLPCGCYKLCCQKHLSVGRFVLLVPVLLLFL